jgi:RNA polymerase sigma-70 factor (ECF subfamily)
VIKGFHCDAEILGGTLEWVVAEKANLRTSDRDALLMMRVAQGDLSAFEELVIRNQSGAWTLAYRYLSDHIEAEDIVQEAFLRLIKSASRYQPTASFRTYFGKIVVRLCLDFRSKKHPVYYEALPENADAAKSAEAHIQDKEAAAEIRRALMDLPPTQRMAFLLRHLEGFSYSEIAEAMDISPKAVDSLLQRGRQTLSTRLHSFSK